MQKHIGELTVLVLVLLGALAVFDVGGNYITGLQVGEDDDADIFDLSDYPSPFVKDGEFNAIVVVGDKAHASAVLSAVDIINGAGYSTVGAIKIASEVDDIRTQNAIVVGGPCANAAAADLLGNPAICAAGFGEGKGVIQLFHHSGGKVSLFVAGYSADDLRRAARVLANYKEWQAAGKLKGLEVEVTGTSFSDISVNAPGPGEVFEGTEVMLNQYWNIIGFDTIWNNVPDSTTCSRDQFSDLIYTYSPRAMAYGIWRLGNDLKSFELTAQSDIILGKQPVMIESIDSTRAFWLFNSGDSCILTAELSPQKSSFGIADGLNMISVQPNWEGKDLFDVLQKNSFSTMIVYEGEPMYVTLDTGTSDDDVKEYTVTLDFVDSNKAMFTVNGEQTSLLSVGEKYVLKDGSAIYVYKRIYFSNIAGGQNGAGFSITNLDMCDFRIGFSYDAGLWEAIFLDTVFTADKIGKGFWINANNCTFEHSALIPYS